VPEQVTALDIEFRAVHFTMMWREVPEHMAG